MSDLNDNFVPLSAHFKQAVEAKKTRLELLGRVDPAAFATFYAADDGAYQQIMHGVVADPDAAKNQGPAYMQKRYLPYMQQNDDAENRVVLIASLRTTGVMVGYTNLAYDGLGRARMGYFVLPSYRGQGLASDFYQAALAQFDRILDDPIRVAEIAPDNTASIRLVEKAGFKYTNRNVPSSFSGHDDPTLYREYMRPKI